MKKQKILSDFITLAGGVLKSFEGAKDYSKMKLKDKVSLIIEDMNFMKKVELDQMKKMIIKSRNEIDELSEYVAFHLNFDVLLFNKQTNCSTKNYLMENKTLNYTRSNQFQIKRWERCNLLCGSK